MSKCCDVIVDDKVYQKKNKILLMGNPNVGKSVIFSDLTGMHVMSSNYAGTTVSYTSATMKLNDEEYCVIDVPGTYSLNATNEAEQVAVSFMESGALAVVCVLDATNLKRNLNLALELKKFGVPIVYALNLVDIADRKGINIDTDILSKELDGDVVNTVAVKGQGIDELKDALTNVVKMKKDLNVETGLETNKEIWDQSSNIVKKCISKSTQKLKFIDRLGELLIKPMPGIPIALLVMVLALGIIVGGGKALRVVLFLPLINNGIVPILEGLVASLALPELLNNILIGEYGIFIIGLEWPLSLILPYVTLFYLVFTFLEDCGFLPRVSVLFDGLMSKLGVQGGSLISLVMGYGCAVPAIIGTRNATTRKERIIISTMVCFAVPCISQSAALIALLSSQSLLLALALFGLSFLIIAIVGVVTGKMMKGNIDPIIIEIPNLLIPEKKSYFKKITVRLKSFLLEAEGPMLLAVVIASLLKETGLLDMAAYAFEPLVGGILGLPKEAVVLLLLGVIRREMAVAPLLTMALTPLQIFVGAVVSLLYLPCLSVFGVLAKEFDAKVATMIGVSTFTCAILLGGIVNFVGNILF